MMDYRFRALPELYWSVLTAAATVLLIELASFNPDAITDWRVWVVALGAGMLRSAAGAVLDWLRRQMQTDPDPTIVLADRILALSEADRARLAVEVERRRAAEGVV